MKKLILKYLQEKPLELRSKFPKILDVFFADDPPRLMVVSDEKIKLPKVVYDGQNIKVELVNTFEVPEQPMEGVAGEDKNITDWKKRYKNIGIVKATIEPVSESINPDSKNAKNIESYEAWKNRYGKK
jgi:hypothetical protein